MTGFKEAIETAVLLFPLVALLFTVPYIIYQYHKYGSVNSWRTVIIYSFILYMMSAYFLVILPLPSREYVTSINKPSYNLQPFLVLGKIFKNTGLNLSDFSTYFPTLKKAVVYEAIFNIFLTIPFGVYLHYYFKCSFKKTLLLSFGLTLFFELTQLTGLYFIYPRSYRVFDVDDLILNTLGGVIGYFVSRFFLLILPSREEIDTESYEKGQRVSLTRRLVCLTIDLFILFLLVLISGILIYRNSLSKLFLVIPFIVYYVLVIIYKRSVGMALLKLGFVSLKDQEEVKHKRVFYYLILFFFLYLGFSLIGILFSYFLYKKHIISMVMLQYLVVFIIAITLIIYIISFIKRLCKKRLWYEKLSGIEFNSTILYNKEEVKDL